MPELIDKQASMKAICDGCFRSRAVDIELKCRGTCNVTDILHQQPTIEQEVRHGHWENIPGMNNTVFCSECLAAANKELAMKYKGCPFCLARMDATDTNAGGKGGADNG